MLVNVSSDLVCSLCEILNQETVDWVKDVKTAIIIVLQCVLPGPGEGGACTEVNTPSLFWLPWSSSLMTPGQNLS